MHNVVCLTVPMDVDAKKKCDGFQVAYVCTADVDVRKSRPTCCDYLLDVGPFMFAVKSVKAHVEEVG